MCKTRLINIFFLLFTNLHIPITKLVLKKFLHENDMYHGFAFFLLPVDGLGVGGGAFLATIRIGIANKSHSMIAIYSILV